MSTSDISIITVTYNSEKFIDGYIQSVVMQKSGIKEIIFVDSNSKDKTPEKIKTYQKKLKGKLNIILIESDENIGYTNGNNKGADIAKGSFLFFLGPDCKLEKDCIDNLIQKTKVTKLLNYFFICRQKRYDTGEFLFDGICTDIFLFPYRLFNYDAPAKSKFPFYCDGTAIYLPKKTFRLIGGFDSDLFMFCDDIDLSWKAHLMKIPLINVPESVVFHYSGGSIKGGIRKDDKYATTYMRRYLGERNTITNFLKNYQFTTLMWMLPLYLGINFIEMTTFFIFGRRRVAFQYLAAWWWNIKKFNKIMDKRKWIQKRRKISDIEIFRRMYFGSGKFNAFRSIRVPTFED